MLFKVLADHMAAAARATAVNVSDARALTTVQHRNQIVADRRELR